ncbi:hypothetical protein GN244_ATG13217 [Phytophthora infestans]|uniref:Uncharacterized protein n=1 Tax=Phytophthora infestans TaxID=4787 RepID=A0A833T6X8_PHYIN|nr:hypothetical protein GN244_ATG13217 [Phytophthora infestans]
MDKVIIDLVNVFPADGKDGALRALLEPYLSKQLRSACVKLKLNPQRRSSAVDNKAGYIDLLCKYRSNKAEGEFAALIGPSKEGETKADDPETSQREPRVERHDAFRLINVLFSPQFVDRMFEADRNQDRANVDKHSINENSQYWLDVARAYNEDRENYNGLEQKERPQYQGIQPSQAVNHSSAKLLDMWKKLTARYTVARGKSKLSGHNEQDFFSYCQGRIDLLYLHDWLQLRPNQLEGVRGRIAKRAQMSTLPGSVESDVDSSSSSGSSSGKKRRLLSPVDRIVNMLESEHKEELEERASGYNSVTRASTAVQSALATLKMLKESNASDEMLQTLEQKVNGLVQRWMAEMDKN